MKLKIFLLSNIFLEVLINKYTKFYVGYITSYSLSDNIFLQPTNSQFPNFSIFLKSISTPVSQFYSLFLSPCRTWPANVQQVFAPIKINCLPSRHGLLWGPNFRNKKSTWYCSLQWKGIEVMWKAGDGRHNGLGEWTMKYMVSERYCLKFDNDISWLQNDEMKSLSELIDRIKTDRIKIEEFVKIVWIII